MAADERLLVIANDTVGGDDLVDEVRRRAGEGGSVHVVVPGGEQLDDPTQDHTVVGGGPTGSATGFGDPQTTDHEESSGTTSTPPGGPASARETIPEKEQARIILEHVLSRLEGVAEKVTGEVGPSDPVEAAKAAVSGGGYDGVVLATVKAGASKLVGKDLPSQVDKAVDVPVATVYGEQTHPAEAE